MVTLLLSPATKLVTCVTLVGILVARLRSLGPVTAVLWSLIGPTRQDPTPLNLVLATLLVRVTIPVSVIWGYLFVASSRTYRVVSLVCRLHRLGRNLTVNICLLGVKAILLVAPLRPLLVKILRMVWWNLVLSMFRILQWPTSCRLASVATFIPRCRLAKTRTVLTLPFPPPLIKT